ncbi:MAG: putative sulfate exporter family transporter [Spirochaetaceae bacterium]|nr:putative sulfate exporter family transporter [Spirochaetaceae bacterium]
MNTAAFRSILPGLVPCLAIAAAATLLGKAVPEVGAAIFALGAGILGRAVLDTRGRKRRPGRDADLARDRGADQSPPRALSLIQKGVTFSSKLVLQVAIVFLGAKTSLTRVAEVGSESLLVLFTSLAAAFLTAWIVGRALKVEPKLAALVGTGTAICGGSAIAAAAPVIGAEETDTAYAFSVIFAFNLAAVFIFPPLGRLFGLSDPGFGLWAGTAINDTSSVVAAGYAWSVAAGDYAVVVKLARTAMIVPVTLALGALASRGAFEKAPSGTVLEASGTVLGGKRRRVAPLPWFILAFLGASLARSLGIIPEAAGLLLAECGVFMIAAALAGIGLATDFRRIVRTGWRPLLLGLAVWFAVAGSSLGVQVLLGSA